MSRRAPGRARGASPPVLTGPATERPAAPPFPGMEDGRARFPAWAAGLIRPRQSPSQGRGAALSRTNADRVGGGLHPPRAIPLTAARGGLFLWKKRVLPAREDRLAFAKERNAEKAGVPDCPTARLPDCPTARLRILPWSSTAVYPFSAPHACC